MILEGVVTTLDEDDSVRVRPMGPEISDNWTTMVLRPFESSHTCRNLRRTGEGVFHVTDDVELIARSAIGQLCELPPVHAAEIVRGMVLSDACRWYGFRVECVEQHPDRPFFFCEVVESGFQREFFGLCRAKHAVVEAAILATRIRLLNRDYLRDELTRLVPLVEKTGGDAERRAWGLLHDHILAHLAQLES